MWQLRTERLEATVPVEGDLAGYRQIFFDPAVAEWLRPPPLEPFSETQIADMLRGDEEHWTVHGFGPWALRERSSGELVGRAGLKWTTVDERLEVELPWAIRSDRWGRGYATEAAAAALEWARSQHLEQVVALVRPQNAASRRVAEKVGFEAVGDTLQGGLAHLVYRLEL